MLTPEEQLLSQLPPADASAFVSKALLSKALLSPVLLCPQPTQPRSQQPLSRERQEGEGGGRGGVGKGDEAREVPLLVAHLRSLIAAHGAAERSGNSSNKRIHGSYADVC
jgi:hypothetical protein